jgi:hypothetical protein
MPLGEAVQRLAGKIILHDLTLELDAVGAMSNHGFHPSKARLTGQCHSTNLSIRRGALQIRGQSSTPFDTQVEVAEDELRPLIDPNGLRIANLVAHPFQSQDDVLAAIAEPGIDRWREPREGVHHRQDVKRRRRNLHADTQSGYGFCGWSWTKSMAH